MGKEQKVGKRGNGEGSISQRKNGTWRTEYVVYPAEGRKRRTVYGKTRAAVSDKLAKALADRAGGLVSDDENMTVGEYVARWLEDSAKGDLAHRTYANYKLQVRRHIVPAIGRVKLARLNPAHVQGLYAAKLRDRLKPSSVRYIHSVLRRSLEQAVRWNLIPHNPAALMDPPKVRQEEIKPLDAEQARALLRIAREVGDRHEALYVLSLATGLRMGEALGLKWSDVDLDAGTLRVNRQLQRMRRQEEEGKPGRLVFSEPKNASRRTVDLPRTAVAALKRHRRRQLEEKLGDGGSYVNSGLVFATVKGTPLDDQNVVNRHFKPLLGRGCPTFAGTISGTRASPSFSAEACTPNSFSTSRGTPAYSSPWTATRTGCRPWANTPRAPWTKRLTRPTGRIRRTTRMASCRRQGSSHTSLTTGYTRYAKMGIRRRKYGREATNRDRRRAPGGAAR